jgi:hypothetical protein
MTYDVHPSEKYTMLDWVKEARKGRAYLYYTGFICRDVDREKDGSTKIKAIRNLAWSLYEKGLVTLVQKKLGPMSYEYIAVRTNRQFK